MPQPMSTPTAAGTMAHRTDGGAVADVHIGHHRHVLMNERQRRDVEQLTPRHVLDRHAVDPRLDRRVAGFDCLWACHDRQLWGW